VLNILTTLLLAVLPGAIGLAATAAAAGEWNMLSDRLVGPGINREVVKLDAKSASLVRVRIDPRGGDLVIHEVRAIHASGGDSVISGKRTVRSGDPSPILDIKGGDVHELVLTYEAAPGANNRILVAVFGETGPARAR